MAVPVTMSCMAGGRAVHPVSSRGNDVLHGGADYRKTGSSWTEDGIDTADYSTSESGITIYLSDGDQAAKDEVRFTCETTASEVRTGFSRSRKFLVHRKAMSFWSTGP